MQENNYPYINLNINGEKRWAHAGWDPEKQQYWSLLPAKNLQDSAYPAGDGTEPNVQGHLATFDKDGKLLDVQAMRWGVEGGLDGFYPTQWPTKADSIYNANAAKTYSTQVFKQVPRQENGGNMNYYQYLQEGGAAENQMGQVVSQVIAALKQNPEETLKKLREMGEQGEQLFEMAVQSDPELQEMFSQSMKCGGKVKTKVKEDKCGGKVRPKVKEDKCGGKVRPKVKKAKCGKKLQEGDKIKKVYTGCACQLKKVGGKLIEVDSCTGLPVKRNGGVMKFQPGGWFKNPFSSWEEFQRQFGAPVDALVRGAKKVYQWMQNNPNNPENRKSVQPQASQESAPKVLTQDKVAAQREESRKGVEALQKQRQEKVQKQFDQLPSEDVPSVQADVQDKFDQLKQSNPSQKETFIQWIQKNINKPGGEDWSSYNNRVMLASKYGINDYKGTAQQNMLLWDRLKHEVNAGVNPTAVQPQRIATPTIGIAVPRIGITTNQHGGIISYKEYLNN